MTTPFAQSSCPRRSYLAVSIAAAFLIGSIPLAATAAEPVDLGQQLTDLYYNLLETEAKLDVANWELSEKPGVEYLEIQQLCPQLDSALIKALRETAEKRSDSLTNIGNKLKDDLAKETKLWMSVTSEDLRFDEEARNAQSIFHFNWTENRPPEFELGWVGWLIALWSLLILVVCGFLCVHEMRRGLRQSRRIVGILLVSTGLYSLSGCSNPSSFWRNGFPRIEDEIAAIRKRIEDAKANYETAKDKVASERKNTISRWKDLLGMKAGEAFEGQEENVAEKAYKLLHETRLTELLRKDATKRLDNLQTDRVKLTSLIERSRSRNIQNKVLIIAGCIVCGLLGFAPLLLVRSRQAKELKKESKICPRCLAEGTLIDIKSTARDKDGKPLSLKECNKCRFKLSASNLKVKRVSFPTAGFKSSGKTQWLLANLDQISNAKVPVEAMLETEMEQISGPIKKFLTMFKQRVAPQGTMYGNSMPEPLTFILRDADSWGSTRVLASVFDFSGEMMDKRVYDDEFRQNALSMNGFMLFLDPTQIEAGSGVLNEALLDRQREQVTQFYLELCKVRGLEDGDVVRVPIAVCVTKFDLLVSHNPIGQMARRKIAELRKMRPGGNLTREEITRRSELCKSMLPVMFQGWDVDDALRKRFGGNIMYFPMSSVSLIDSELGITDLKKRTLAPFGILEPFLWLLHMQGFCIFED